MTKNETVPFTFDPLRDPEWRPTRENYKHLLDTAVEQIEKLRDEATDHRQMARAAIRVALRHKATDSEIADEYDIVREGESRGR